MLPLQQKLEKLVRCIGNRLAKQQRSKENKGGMSMEFKWLPWARERSKSQRVLLAWGWVGWVGRAKGPEL